LFVSVFVFVIVLASIDRLKGEEEKLFRFTFMMFKERD